MKLYPMSDVPVIAYFRGQPIAVDHLTNMLRRTDPIYAFVSQPFQDISEEQVMTNMHNAGKAITTPRMNPVTTNYPVIIFDLYHAPYRGSHTKNIAAALEILDTCDFAVFVDWWRSCGGCQIEYKYAQAKRMRRYIFDGTRLIDLED